MVSVMYICNRKKCGKKCSKECKHTFDYNYAKNKDKFPNDISKAFDLEITPNIARGGNKQLLAAIIEKEGWDDSKGS